MASFLFRKSFPTFLPKSNPDKDLLVLITGASKGIGKEAALALAAEGYQVYGTVRKESDGEQLVTEFLNSAGGKKNKGSIRPVVMDVRDVESIDKSYDTIQEAMKNGGLFVGLVNNAGVAAFGLAETMTDAEVRNLFDINLFGVMNVTRKFLPLIRESKGRIVMVSSLVGVLSLPGSSGYSATKFALEGYSDALRREVRDLDISVSIVEPGAIATPIIDNFRADAHEKTAVPVETDEVSEAYKDVQTTVNKMIESILSGAVSPAVSTTPAILQALHDKYPKTRYLVGAVGRQSAATFAKFVNLLPDRKLDDWVFQL